MLRTLLVEIFAPKSERKSKMVVHSLVFRKVLGGGGEDDLSVREQGVRNRMPFHGISYRIDKTNNQKQGLRFPKKEKTGKTVCIYKYLKYTRGHYTSEYCSK